MVLSVAIIISMVVSLTADADDVRAAAEGRARSRHGCIDWTRARFRVDHLHLWRPRCSVVLNHPALTHGRDGGDDRRERVSVHEDSEGLFPAAGYRASAGQVQGQQHISFAALSEKVAVFRTAGPQRSGRRIRWTRSRAAAADAAVELRADVLQLKPLGERTATADEVIARIRRKTAGMPGATLFLQSAQDIRIGGRQANAQYQYTLQTQDLAVLARLGTQRF